MEQADITKVIKQCEFGDFNTQTKVMQRCKNKATTQRNIGKHFAEFYDACEEHATKETTDERN